MRIRNGAGGGAPPEPAPKPDLVAVMAFYGLHVFHSGKQMCLVHDESRPSMSVDLEQGLWRCHSCGQGGDAWTLIEIKEEVDHRGARDFATTANFESEAVDRSGDDIQHVLGRRRGGVPDRKRTSRGWKGGRPW